MFAARQGGLARCFSNKIAVVPNWQYKKVTVQRERRYVLTSKKLYQSHWERHACILPTDTRPSRPGYHSEVVTYPGWMCGTRKRRDACLNRRFMPRSVLVTVSNRAWLPSLAALRR